MTWRNREKTDPERRFKDQERDMSLDNLVANKVLDSYPELDTMKDNSLSMVNDSGSLYLVTKFNGKRLRAPFSEF